MRAEVAALLDQELDPDVVLARFEDKYGPTILAAPSTEGWFDLSAWLMPFVGLIAGTAGLALLVRRFRRRGIAAEAVEEPTGANEVSRYNARMEDDLADFTPED
jgi:cytochrome c-type biogenesis protein CcmH